MINEVSVEGRGTRRANYTESRNSRYFGLLGSDALAQHV